MRFVTVLTAGVTALSLSLGGMTTTAQSQGLRSNSGPAEQPPASFSGRQYVDSKGCVFIKAGYGGQVTWVPRVSRSRKALCGYSPTRSGGGQTTTSASARPTGPITIVERAPQSTAAAPAPAPVRTRTVAAAPVVTQPRPVVTQPVRTVRAAPVVTVAPRVVTQPSTFNATNQAAPCGASSLSARYLSGCDGQVTRRSVATRLRGTTAPTTARGVIPAQTRNSVYGKPVTAPQRRAPAATTGGCQGASALSARYLKGADTCRSAHTYWNSSSAATVGVTIQGPIDRVTRIVRSTQGVAVPKGYREVWNDGRLNAYRGIGNAQGAAQMRQIWNTNEPFTLRTSN